MRKNIELENVEIETFWKLVNLLAKRKLDVKSFEFYKVSEITYRYPGIREGGWLRVKVTVENGPSFRMWYNGRWWKNP